MVATSRVKVRQIKRRDELSALSSAKMQKMIKKGGMAGLSFQSGREWKTRCSCESRSRDRRISPAQVEKKHVFNFMFNRWTDSERRSKSSCFCGYFTEKVSPSGEQNQVTWSPNSYADIWSLNASKSPAVTVKPADFGLFPHRHGLFLNRERRPFAAPGWSFIDGGPLERFCAQGSKVRVSLITGSERLIDGSVAKVRPPLTGDAGTRGAVFGFDVVGLWSGFQDFFKETKAGMIPDKKRWDVKRRKVRFGEKEVKGSAPGSGRNLCTSVGVILLYTNDFFPPHCYSTFGVWISSVWSR